MAGGSHAGVGRNSAPSTVTVPPAAPCPQRQEVKETCGQEGRARGCPWHLTACPGAQVCPSCGAPAPDCELQLTKAVLGREEKRQGGRRTGWAVWDGRFSPVHRFPVPKLSLQDLAVVPVGSTAMGQERGTDPWPAALAGHSPRSGAAHTSGGQCQSLLASHRRGRFPSLLELTAPSRRQETCR